MFERDFSCGAELPIGCALLYCRPMTQYLREGVAVVHCCGGNTRLSDSLHATATAK